MGIVPPKLMPLPFYSVTPEEMKERIRSIMRRMSENEFMDSKDRLRPEAHYDAIWKALWEEEQHYRFLLRPAPYNSEELLRMANSPGSTESNELLRGV